MTKHAYIHIPFCLKKCNYCAFISTCNLKYVNEYIIALKEQIKKEYKNEELETIYFGGGTPSILKPEQLLGIINLFNFNKKTEITLEINPESVNEQYFKELKTTPINRLSFGFQTFNDEMLKILGRLHNSQKAVQTLQYAQKYGFKNISIDLIYGIPTQTLKDIEADVEQALSLNIQHISLYGLKIEENTPFYFKQPKNLPDNDLQADMYEKIIEILTKNGFIHYEISNFAKENYSSKHNLSYWKNKNYYGFGLAASGYEGNIRYTNETKLKNYLINPLKKENSQELSKQEILEEEIFLGLRCSQGINIANIEQKFNINFKEKYGKMIEKYILSKHLKMENDTLSLTKQGMLLSNIIMSEFIE